MNKQILIHIGPPKSGTSAIQYALHNARHILRCEGIDYPRHEVGPNGISSGNMNTILSLNEDGKWQVCEDKIRHVLNEFERSDLDMLLLSSEYFFYLAKEIAKSIPQAQFIAYLRCPLETFESSYNQSVKRHMRTTALSFGKNLHITSLNILTDTIQHIGKKRFILRAYLPISEQGYNLIEDFWSAAGLPDMPSSKVVTNNSYCFEALEFKRWLNQFELTNLDTAIDQALQAFSDRIQLFSFLPKELFERYQKQALHNVRDFVHDNKVFNGKILITYLKHRSSLKHLEQTLSKEDLTYVCAHLALHHSVLYSQICSKLNRYTSSDSELTEKIILVLNHQKNYRTLLAKIMRRIKW
ncbi:MAG: hypothetical protein ACJAT7_003876 [Psychromonas sp.]|jgi:hypothetical protein|uniref:hypothetical protein n=1 Tax=Psychromonas sp. TaxID=1884585 RepID=UPI0039E30421